MAAILFWNLGRQVPASTLRKVAVDQRPDLLVLVETSQASLDILSELNAPGHADYHLPFNVSSSVSLYSRYPRGCIRSVADYGRVAIRHVVPPVGLDFILVAAHLPSKRNMTADDQAAHSSRLASQIRAAESTVGHDRTVVIGDLNMNPFDTGMVSSEGLHAVMDRAIARTCSRTVQGVARPFFYNPMWSRMGDASAGPPGTYYRSASSYVEYFWHTFDQVLIRPCLLDYVADSDVQVLTSAGDILLSGTSGRPAGGARSDHYPVRVKLSLEGVYSS